MAEIQEIVFKVAECVPYQLCPKCNGIGTVSSANMNGYVFTSTIVMCDVCNGAKIIPMHVIPNVCHTVNAAE